MNITKFEKELGKIIKELGDSRDKLDELISEAESIKSDCQEAIEQLIWARDALSRFV